jgi:hypothetical protein
MENAQIYLQCTELSTLWQHRQPRLRPEMQVRYLRAAEQHVGLYCIFCIPCNVTDGQVRRDERVAKV